MTHSHTLPGAGASSVSTATEANLTRVLLACGIAAGPVYLVVSFLQAFLREGFDIRRHAFSLLSNGDLGWIQITNFLVSGLLVVAAAVGMRRVVQAGPGRTWGPLLVGAYGVGLIAAGVFVADPALGFPPGTPAGQAAAMSWHSVAHFISAALAFLALIAACFVFARRFAALGQRGWAWYSVATGVAFFAAFFGIAAGSGQDQATVSVVNLAFLVAVVLAWGWLSAISARLRKSAPGGA
jgi:Protein of unknown function (DUF998)